MQNYLLSVTSALKGLRNELNDEHAQTVIDHCVCTLSGLINMTSVESANSLSQLLASLPEQSGVGINLNDTSVLLTAPPESLAVTSSTASMIQHGAEWIAQHSEKASEDIEAFVKKLVLEESALIEDGFYRMSALQRHQPKEKNRQNDDQIAHDDVARFFQREDLAIPKGELVSARQVFGGRSRQTLLFSLQHGDGGRGDYVIQRDNPVAGKPQSVVDEFPLLCKLYAESLKVPKPLLVESDPDWIGAPFMVVEQVPGSVAQIDYFGAPPSQLIVEEFARELAKLHDLDPDTSLGLQSTVSQSGNKAWVEELGRLRESWGASKNWPSICVSAALKWMKDHVDELELTDALVHGDPAFHNVLWDGSNMTALLDWELAHIGHPAEDLGYCRGAVSQVIPWTEFIALYEGAGGHKFSKVTLDYFSLRAIINIMDLIQRIRANIDEGKTMDVGVADLGASFIPKLTHRLSNILVEVLSD